MTALSTYILTHSPSRLFLMDEASGYPQDSSGNGGHISAPASLAPFTYELDDGLSTAFPGAGSKSIKSDGSGSGYMSGAGAFGDDANWTFIGLCKTVAEFGTVISYGRIHHVVQGWGIDCDATRYRMVSNGVLATADANAAASVGTWYLLIGVVENNVLKLYVDGVLQTDTATFDGSTPGAANVWMFGAEVGFAPGTFTANLTHCAIIKGTAFGQTEVDEAYDAALGGESYTIFNGGDALADVNWMGDGIDALSRKTVTLLKTELAALLAAPDVAVIGPSTSSAKKRAQKIEIAGKYQST